MADEKIMTSSSEIKKDFKFQKGECTLSFTLRIDNSSQLRDFLPLLVAAQASVEEEIAKLKN